ncbi:glycosyl hydrolase family 18 protein [Oleispirillum naphthae]|uniref:glycosyl hydrolase family 18 protein n=1 Tax=Oleispirillum naphthae TaxID=2838853 RepID=UPI003082363A
MPRPTVAYLLSWAEHPALHAEDTGLARLPDNVNVIILAFVRPDAVYSGSENLSSTGFSFPYPRALLAQAIAERKARLPGTRVLIAVGGATYGAWRALDHQAIARLVADLGADGVDIDMELDNPACGPDGGAHVSCSGGRLWRLAIERFRAALPPAATISIAGWSVAAYGEGAWAEAKPRSPHTGELLGLFRHEAGKKIDLINVMAYNATADYDAAEAYRAYRAAWPGPLAVGILVPPDNGRQPDISLEGVRSLCRVLAADPQAGLMIYGFGIEPPPGKPSAADIAQEAAGCLHAP